MYAAAAAATEETAAAAGTEAGTLRLKERLKLATEEPSVPLKPAAATTTAAAAAAAASVKLATDAATAEATEEAATRSLPDTNKKDKV